MRECLYFNKYIHWVPKILKRHSFMYLFFDSCILFYIEFLWIWAPFFLHASSFLKEVVLCCMYEAHSTHVLKVSPGEQYQETLGNAWITQGKLSMNRNHSSIKETNAICSIHLLIDVTPRIYHLEAGRKLPSSTLMRSRLDLASLSY